MEGWLMEIGWIEAAELFEEEEGVVAGAGRPVEEVAGFREGGTGDGFPGGRGTGSLD